MREIKFRAWDKDEGCWIPQDQIAITGKGEIFTIDQQAGWLQEVIDIVICEYTGLKDKNGKEIFEGDIVKLCDTNPVMFKVESILVKYGYKFVFRDIDNGRLGGSYFLDKCEVIGNIYSNPELLEGEE